MTAEFLTPIDFEDSNERQPKKEIIPSAEIHALKEVRERLIDFINRDIEARTQGPEIPSPQEFDEIVGTDFQYKREKIEEQTGIRPAGPEARTLRIRTRVEAVERHLSSSVRLLRELEVYLDNLDIWKYKFTTHDGRSSEVNKSVYYISESGVSLRLKRAELYEGLDGLNRVIKPYQEKIFFIDPNNLYHKSLSSTEKLIGMEPSGKFIPTTSIESDKISNSPGLGWRVEEYTSKQFRDLWKVDNLADFESGVTTSKQGNLTQINVRDVADAHPGHQVDEILFKK